MPAPPCRPWAWTCGWRASASAPTSSTPTWYANFGAHVASLLGGMPHVVTAHSLEPMRPWKAEQLGGGYRVSSFVERTAFGVADAVIAVSAGMREDVLRSYPSVDPDRVHVVHNGIDSQPAAAWDPDTGGTPVSTRPPPPSSSSGASPGRRGCPPAARRCGLPPDVQLVLCAGAPRHPEILAEVEGLMDDLRAQRDEVVWIPEMLPAARVTALLSAATVFACPSVYEPLGIVNLEAMACRLPVVATATGGIPEVVVPGETGWLVPIEQVQDGTGIPLTTDIAVADLAAALVEAVSDPSRPTDGPGGRQRRRRLLVGEHRRPDDAVPPGAAPASRQLTAATARSASSSVS